MSISTQKSLDAIVSLLRDIDLSRPRLLTRGQQSLRGLATNDLLNGNVLDNDMFGSAGDDLILGRNGSDTLRGGTGDDGLVGGNGNDTLFGNQGNDTLMGDQGVDSLFGGIGDDVLLGGTENDTLVGGAGNDQLVGGDGVDSLTGGAGQDLFVVDGNVFANGTPAPAGTTGINVLNQPDVIADYTIGEDKFAFEKASLNIKEFVFQQGQTAQITGNANAIVLLTSFAAAGAAARAIANNNNITAKEGVFLYFNTTLGLNRLVYSQDLANGGNISVLANLNNQRGDAGIASLARFSAADFTLM